MLSILGGAMLLAVLRHENVFRDVYPSREDCEADWGYREGDCEPGPEASRGGGSGFGYYYGPTYEQDSRPRTRYPDRRISYNLVKRGGFGFSGARFSGGS
jgi:hypothetical protein